MWPEAAKQLLEGMKATQVKVHNVHLHLRGPAGPPKADVRTQPEQESNKFFLSTLWVSSSHLKVY